MRSVVEIDISQIVKNADAYEKASGKELMLTVKADAYGHGAVECSKALEKAGYKHFAVACVQEAVELRKAGIKGKILILGYTPPEEYKDLIEYDLIQTLISKEHADDLWEVSKYPIKAHFAIDTGMNRIGLDADDLDFTEKVIRENYKRFNLLGIFTHLSVADASDSDNVDFTDGQIEKLKHVKKRVEDLNIKYCHCLNSAGGVYLKERYGDFARLGIMLYGLKPSYTNVLPKGIKPCLSWKSYVSMVKTVKAGESIGYGRTSKPLCDRVIATVTSGYADGVNRLLSNKGYVLVNGKRANIIGRICMDQFMIDVTEINGVKAGTEVVLIGKSGNEEITADDIAYMTGTISYEVVCRINKRVTVKYVNKD